MPLEADLLNFVQEGPVTALSVLINLALATLLSLLLGWHFRRFGSTFSNRSRFARIFPALALTTVLIITVIKSSLALSLGLVGALSIVRFRTPIKDPEELAYLFLAIAIGLGLGANQRWLTVVALPAILMVMAMYSTLNRGSGLPNLYFNVAFPGNEQDKGEQRVRQILDSITPHVSSVDLRRLDVHGGRMQATFHMDCRDVDSMLKVQEEIRSKHPDSELSFVEQSGVPGN